MGRRGGHDRARPAADRARPRAAEPTRPLANERVEKLFDDAPHGVALLDPCGSIIRVNISMAVPGGPRPARHGGPPARRVRDPGRDRIEDHLGRGCCSTAASPCSGVPPARLRRQRRQRLPEQPVVGDAQMGEIVMVNVVDISDRRRYLDRLAHLADHDVLTGLANRRRFETSSSGTSTAADATARPARCSCSTSTTSSRSTTPSATTPATSSSSPSPGCSRRSIRSTDVVARLGGDEFAILLTDGDQTDAARVARPRRRADRATTPRPSTGSPAG